KKKSEERGEGGRDSKDEEQLNYQYPYIAGQLIDENNEANGTDNDKSNINVNGSSNGNSSGGSSSTSNANLVQKHGETNTNKSHNPMGSCSGRNNTILTELDKCIECNLMYLPPSTKTG
ncbi:hypothetical protein RFI_31524, partial [Reticulomyxa filosa]